jgi:hypothetical protein
VGYLPTVHAFCPTDKLFIEKRPEGNFAVRKPHSERASAVESTPAEAITKARQLNPGAEI